MRVDLLTPCFWPEVRRGTERFTHELAQELLGLGHAPRIVTSHRANRPARATEDGVPVLRVPRPLEGRYRRRLWEDYVTHTPFSAAALYAGRPDVAHAMAPPDAATAGRWGRRTGRPTVFSFMGVPYRVGLVYRRHRLRYVTDALRDCDVVVALSRAAVDEFRRTLGHEARLIPPGVDVDAFAPGPARSPHPTVVCAADAAEPRKRVGLVIEAFARVRRDRPDARLVLSRPRDARLARELGDQPGVELADLDDRTALADAYARAWVSVLASHGEAFGLVLLEAMACGTPAVGSATGGIPEVIDRPEVGRTFDGTVEDLADALLEVFDLAESPSTTDRCRARAEELSTARTARSYLELYEELAAR